MDNDLFEKGLAKRKATLGADYVQNNLDAADDFSMPFLLSPDEASKRIIKAIEQRKLIAIFPKRLYFLFKLLTFFPKTWIKKNSPKIIKLNSENK